VCWCSASEAIETHAFTVLVVPEDNAPEALNVTASPVAAALSLLRNYIC